MAKREAHLVVLAGVILTIVHDARFVASDTADIIHGAFATDGEAGHAVTCADGAHPLALLSDFRYSCCHVVVVAVVDIDCAQMMANGKHIEITIIRILDADGCRGEDAVGECRSRFFLCPAYQSAAFISAVIAVVDAAREDAAAHVK